MYELGKELFVCYNDGYCTKLELYIKENLSVEKKSLNFCGSKFHILPKKNRYGLICFLCGKKLI